MLHGSPEVPPFQLKNLFLLELVRVSSSSVVRSWRVPAQQMIPQPYLLASRSNGCAFYTLAVSVHRYLYECMWWSSTKLEKTKFWQGPVVVELLIKSIVTCTINAFASDRGCREIAQFLERKHSDLTKRSWAVHETNYVCLKWWWHLYWSPSCAWG